MSILFRRWWWKPWNWSTRTWLMAIFVSILILPFISRWICLWQVPDVALPFDVDKFIGDEVSKEEDAFTKYAAVIKTLSAKSPVWLDDAVGKATEPLNPAWDDRLDQWLVDNADVLTEIKNVTELERALGFSLRTSHIYTLIPIHQEFRKIARMLAVEAARCERSGKLEEAWTWHRAGINLAAHAEKPGFPVANAIGRAIRNNVFSAVSRWAAHPSLTADQLHAARAELVNKVSQRMKFTEVVKVDYILLRNTLKEAHASEDLFTEWANSTPFAPVLSICQQYFPEAIISVGLRSLLWSTGQPELTARISRQILVNQISQVEKPVHLRHRAVRAEYPLVFDLDPERKRRSGQLDADQLSKTLQGGLTRFLIREGYLTQIGSSKNSPFDAEQGHRIGDAGVAMIEVVLAAHEFQRRRGEFPEALEQLVLDFLDAVPLDPLSSNGAPLNYLRDEWGEARIWSVGQNGTDDGGDIDGLTQNDTGYRIRLKPLDEMKSPPARTLFEIRDAN